MVESSVSAIFKPAGPRGGQNAVKFKIINRRRIEHDDVTQRFDPDALLAIPDRDFHGKKGVFLLVFCDFMEKNIKGLGGDKLRISPEDWMEIENYKVQILVFNMDYKGLVISFRVV